MNIINIYEPEYVRRFQCNGGGCLCTCCIGKEIPLDKISTQAYLKSADEDIRTVAQQSIQLAKTDLENWGTIHLTRDNYCPFFDKGRSCTYCLIGRRDDLHTRPKFCLDYPYVDIRWQNEVRKSLAIECPEACGQILMSQTSIWLESKKLISSRSQSPLSDIYHQVNAECIGIALRPELSLSERLMAIGELVSPMSHDDYTNKKQKHQAIEELHLRAASLTHEHIKSHMSEIPRNNVARWQLFAQIGSQVAELANVETVPTMAAFWKEVHHDILQQSTESGAQKIADLENAWMQTVTPVFNEFPHVVTNYLFYRLYHDSFPYHAKMSEVETYYQLITDCFILRNLISYWALKYSQLRKSKMIDIVNIYHRWRRQYPETLKLSANSLKEARLYHPKAILQLLLNPAS
ncbi:flagellin lysine-N-methylase [Budviciaceae bacterium BWR-B9]|uniref:Flagellin lysine-N-methylase n=1 Tax=Limnobaculum allomyrinae TaxID=2791986 RepID=A0ABS1IVY6_9GAMM|nr:MULTISPECIES: flagellin lysine-N-methylase [Limnobaculum]MBK5145696.1 flagellin lysine-N-methylase [Limnobaculum allomyrinae]MBV7693770.1 flagellin lysine-N-methylase [Limnobaculum sp. M2-1]